MGDLRKLFYWVCSGRGHTTMRSIFTSWNVDFAETRWISATPGPRLPYNAMEKKQIVLFKGIHSLLFHVHGIYRVWLRSVKILIICSTNNSYEERKIMFPRHWRREVQWSYWKLVASSIKLRHFSGSLCWLSAAFWTKQIVARGVFPPLHPHSPAVLALV